MSDQTRASAITGAAARRRPRFTVRPALWRGALSLVAAAALWEWAATYLVKNRLFFAPLSAVVAKLGDMWAAGTLQTDIMTSMQTFLIGFVIGSVAAIVRRGSSIRGARPGSNPSPTLSHVTF